MAASIISALALMGFAFSNAFETALLTLSFADEKKLARGLGRTVRGKVLVRFYQHAFEQWRRYPTDFLAVILALQSFFSMLWCILGLSRWTSGFWTPVLIGAGLFLFGELLPKVLARRFPERMVLFLLPVFYAARAVLRNTLVPLTSFLERITRLHIPAILTYPLSKKEIKALLADPELSSDLRPPSRLILESLLNFSSRKVREAMRPSREVFILDAREGNPKTILEKVTRHAYSRIPVSADGTLANTIGILYAKDLLFTFATSGLLHLNDILRESHSVQEEDRLGSVLEKFRQGGIHLALVKDNKGVVKGIISLEDILEEFVGEIGDEFK